MPPLSLSTPSSLSLSSGVAACREQAGRRDGDGAQRGGARVAGTGRRRGAGERRRAGVAAADSGKEARGWPPVRAPGCLAATLSPRPTPRPTSSPCSHPARARPPGALSAPPPHPPHILLDSIAMLYRAGFDASLADLNRRSALLFQKSAKLKELACKHQCVVVVANQVVHVVEGDAGNNVAWSSGHRVSPALGISWANCVNTRLFLRRELDTVGGSARRLMKVPFVPHLPERSCEFVIRRDGVFGVDPAVRRDINFYVLSSSMYVLINRVIFRKWRQESLGTCGN